MKREYQNFIYIMSNFERTTFYIGVTSNLIRRVIDHKNGIGSIFTNRYKLKFLIYYEEYQYVNDAIRREKELKGWNRNKKINLIKQQNSEFKDISGQMFKEFEISEEELSGYLQENKLSNKINY